MGRSMLAAGVLVAAFATLSSVPLAFAQVTNGTFDGWTSVNHPGWNTIGLVSGRYPDIYQEAPNTTEPPATMQTPDSFTFQAEGGATPAEIAAMFGGPITAADILPLDTSSFDPSFGSAIAQTFTNPSAGQKLTFQWNFVSFDSVGQDFAFIYLTGPGGTVIQRLAGQEGVSPTPDDLDGISGQIGLTTFTSSPLAAGSYRIGLSVMNSNGNINAGGSALIVDNVMLVPEPACLALVGLAGLSVVRRRTRA